MIGVAQTHPGAPDTVQVFRLPATGDTITGKRHIPFTASSKNITPYTITVPATDKWISLYHSYFELKIRFQKTNAGARTAVLAADNVNPVIGLPHTMIRQFTAHLNGTLLNPQNDTYPYRWYMTNLLNYTPAEGSAVLRPEGWLPVDPKTGYAPINMPRTVSANKFNLTANAGAGHADFTNSSLTEQAALRQTKEAGAKLGTNNVRQYFFKPNIEIFHNDRVYPPNMEQVYTIYFNSPAFFIDGATVTPEFDQTDIDITFHMCVVDLKDTLYKQISEARHSRGTMLEYPMVRSEIRTYVHNGNQLLFAEDNIFGNRIPDRMMIGILHQNCFNGTLTYHPYAFEKFNVKSVKQTINGEEYPYRTLELIHNNDTQDMAGYFRFLDAAGFLDKGEASMIRPEMWGQGQQCTLFAFDNTANSKADGPMLNLKQRGNLRLEIQFGAVNTDLTLVVLVWGEFENILKISPQGAILYDVLS